MVMAFVTATPSADVLHGTHTFFGGHLTSFPRCSIKVPYAVAVAPVPPVVAPPKASLKTTERSPKLEKMRSKYAATETSEDISGFSYADFDKAMENFSYSFHPGDTCVGTVYQFEPNGALVDVGAKASAFIQTVEVSMTRVDRPEDALTVGEEREFQIISNEDENGQMRLSLRRIEFARAWDRVAQLQAEDVTVFAEVLSINRGGAMVRLEGLRAFLPGSHMAIKTDREALIGTELPLKFLEVDQTKNRLVVSHRRAIVERQMSRLSPGALVEGHVQVIKPYGVFVDIGGLSGLLHISQISHDHISDISAIFEEKSPVKCMVINQDKEKGRISLSTKTLEPEPGDMLRDSAAVYERAEEMTDRYHKRLEEERRAAAEVADDIVSTLDMASLDDLEVDPVGAVGASSSVE